MKEFELISQRFQFSNRRWHVRKIQVLRLGNQILPRILRGRCTKFRVASTDCRFPLWSFGNLKNLGNSQKVTDFSVFSRFSRFLTKIRELSKVISNGTHIDPKRYRKTTSMFECFVLAHGVPTWSARAQWEPRVPKLMPKGAQREPNGSQKGAQKEQIRYRKGYLN